MLTFKTLKLKKVILTAIILKYQKIVGTTFLQMFELFLTKFVKNPKNGKLCFS